MDCLIIGYSEPSRLRETQQFFNKNYQGQDGWQRYLHLNYINFENNIVSPANLLSLAFQKNNKKEFKKDTNGYFLYEDLNVYSLWRVPLLGGIYIYQYLKKRDLDVELIYHTNFEKQKFEQALSKSPRVIAISSTLILNPIDLGELIHYLRSKSPSSFIVIGGMRTWTDHIADKKNHEQFKMYMSDAIILDAKGSKTLFNLVLNIKNNLPLHNIPNLVIFERSPRKTITTNVKNEIFNFSIDSIDWNLVSKQHLSNITWLRTQVSCPFKCTFCSFPVTQGPVQFKDLSVFENELKTLESRGVKYLLFADDNFNFPKNRFIKILNILKKFDFKWFAYIRCQYIDKETARMMKECGCTGVNLGIESANDRILKIMNKQATKEEYLKGISALSSQKIIIYASLIVGFPQENNESLNDIKDFVLNSGINYYNLKCFFYYPIIPIADLSKEFELEGKAFQWKHKTMTSAQAFSHAEKIICEIPSDIPMIPQHSGELWEIGYLMSQGFSEQQIFNLYKNFTLMIQDELSNSPNQSENQRKLFEQLI